MKKISKIVMGFVVVATMMFGFTSVNNVKAAVGDTIAQTLPDTNLAQVVADQVAGGNVNTILTQGMADSVQTLYASNLNISDITGIEIFTELRTLDLSRNKITSIPIGVSALTRVSDLNLSYNEITVLPDIFGGMTGLMYLDVDHNKIAVLPDSIGSLINLSVLHAEFNTLGTLPDSIFDLYWLKELYAGGNPDIIIPEAVTNLRNLNVIDLSSANLTTIPDTVCRVPNLTHLNMSDNKIAVIPDSLANAIYMSVLTLHKNNLSDLPAFIGNMPIRQLKISYNNFTVLPSFISDYTTIELLDVSFNQLTNLPSNFANLSAAPFNNPIYIGDNLLPSTSKVYLTGLGLPVINEPQDQLNFTTIPSFDIKNGEDYNNVNYIPYLALDTGRSLSPDHNYKLENYMDENMNAIDINDYIQNGTVLKTGKVFAQVRATGAGLFPDTSDHAVTTEALVLNFQVVSNLIFDLNGGAGVTPETQSLVEGTLGTAVPNPTREGYTFKGWNTAQDGSGITWDFAATVMPTNDVTLYAQWEKNNEPIPPVDPVNPVNPVNPTNPKANLNVPVTGDITNAACLFALLTGSGIVMLILRRKKVKA